MSDFSVERKHFLSYSRLAPEQFQQPQVFSLTNGTQVHVHAPGIIEFIPVSYRQGAGRHVLYSCGVHGNETAPIEICDEIVEAILNKTVIINTRLMVQFANLPAMDIAERFVEENLNRLFTGAHEPQTNYERKRAQQLEFHTHTFFNNANDKSHCFHYDLHTAIRDSAYPRFAVYPFKHGKMYSSSQLEWLAQAGIDAVLLSESPTTTYSYFSSRDCGVHSFTVELGKVKPFGENNMADFSLARSALFRLILPLDQAQPFAEEVSEQRAKQLNFPVLFRINQSIIRSEQHFSLHFSDDTPNFTSFNQGEVLASECNEQGQTIKEFTAQQDGEAIVFPNAKVAIGQRALLTVVPVTIKDLTIDV